MPESPFQNHTSVIQLLEKAQNVETDVRDKVREVDVFLNQPWGQWEDTVSNTWQANDRPRYQFDRCQDMVDDVAGEMEQADFAIKIRPAGGDATKDLAKTYDGLIRNIENLSNAQDIFNAASRKMVSGGFDAWRVKQRFGDNNSFDQDLYIDEISDAVNSVWWDHNSTKQTREDAEYCFVLQSLTKAVYDEKFPKGTGKSISRDSDMFTYNEPEVVVIGEFLYKERKSTRIVEMNNGSVYVDDEKYQRIKDELANQGVTETRERFREMVMVKTRLMDGEDWLTPPQDTVFEFLPVVPIYGNWTVTKKVPSYRGLITGKMDAQRVFNYAESRKVEETALSPKDKIVVTDEQIGAYKDEWEKLNTSTDPFLPYEHQDGQPPPYKIGGAQLNPGLESVTQSAKENLQSTAGLDLQTGQSPGLQSGVAVELKQNKGDTRNYKYHLSKSIAICYTGKILSRAIPKVYDTRRQVRILGEDDTFELVMLNDQVFDEETGQMVTVNDLSQGLYDVTCEMGPAFKNRQSETAQHFKDIAEIDPTVIQDGADIWYGSLDAPGMELMAERKRQQMLMAGVIPEEQMTDEEREVIANLPEPEPDPVALALQQEQENESDKIQIQAMEFAHKEQMDLAKLQMEQNKQIFEGMQALAKELNTQADTWKKMREAMGLETISGPGGIKAFIDQAGLVQEVQAEQ